MPIDAANAANTTASKSHQATPCYLICQTLSLKPLSYTVIVAKVGMILAPKLRAKLILINQMLKLSKPRIHRFIQPDKHYSPLFKTHFLSCTFDPTRSATCSSVCLIESFGCFGNLDLSVGCQLLWEQVRDTASSKLQADQVWSGRCLALPF